MTAGKVLVTGGLGFIGSAFVRMLAATGVTVMNVDAQTYAGDPRRLNGQGGRVTSLTMNVNSGLFARLVGRERPDVIVHFAAESHVTRSEGGADLFFETNVRGTQSVMEAAVGASCDLVLHVSTDEVYGPCHGRPFREEDKLPGEGLATSAYARSKALADDLALSYSDRVGVIVARLTNCFGPWQHPEKAIPRWAIRALTGQQLPVWGSGRQVRDWMFVDDACRGLELLMKRGIPGDVYNVGPEAVETTNFEIARIIARYAGRDESCAYLTDYDRPQHDFRYAIDASKIRRLGWKSATVLEERLSSTVGWYRENMEWWKPLVREAERIYQDIPALST